jgi:hypothetical protein
MSDPPRTIDVLTRLREIGVAVSLDDFGAGHSSLAHLKQLRVDKLKIDQSFVLNIADDPHNAAIVRSIVDLAHRLNLHVIAEDVEKHAAWKLLGRQTPNAAPARPWLVNHLQTARPNQSRHPATPVDARRYRPFVQIPGLRRRPRACKRFLRLAWFIASHDLSSDGSPSH